MSINKHGYAEIGNQIPLRTEWYYTLQVQVLLPIFIFMLLFSLCCRLIGKS
jgi:hypothetical protein